MNAADRKFLKHLETKVDETHKGVNYILNEIPVNGVMGLKCVLTQHHADIKAVKGDIANLKDRGEVLWRATEAIRAKAEFWRSWKRLCERSPVLRFITNMLTHKIVAYAVAIILVFSVLVMFGISVGEAIDKVSQLFGKSH